MGYRYPIEEQIRNTKVSWRSMGRTIAMGRSIIRKEEVVESHQFKRLVSKSEL